MQKKKKRDKRNGKGLAISLIVTGALMFGGTAVLNKSIENITSEHERISYTEYMEYLENGDVDIVTYSLDGKDMNVILFNDETRNLSVAEREKYEHDSSQVKVTYYPANEDFKKELLEKGVIVKLAEENGFIKFLSNLDTYMGMIIVLVLLIALGKSSPLAAKDFYEKIDAKDLKVGFDDVIGLEEIKGDLKLLVKQLKEGKNVTDLSRGVLFEGSAGTGKTMLAQAIAKEAGTDFISVNSSGLIAMYVGLGAKRVRDVFKEARKGKSCVIFFDEFDAVGRERGNAKSTGENDQTINALLTELDGFSERGNILVIAATNRADKMDKALLRAGRFDRKVVINPPADWETRQKMFDKYLKNRETENVDTEVLAKQVVGFSGADIASVCREAGLIAFSVDSNKITQEHLEEAVDKIVFKGNRSDKTAHEKELERTAFHEAGHTISKYELGESVARVSIMSMTNGAGGVTFYSDTGKMCSTKKDIENAIISLYAGRAAEEVMYGTGKVSSGASNDIEKATELLKAYVYELGFDDEIGLVKIESTLPDEYYIKRLGELSKKLYQQAVELITEKKEKLRILANELLKNKSLSGKEVEELLGYSSEKKEV